MGQGGPSKNKSANSTSRNADPRTENKPFQSSPSGPQGLEVQPKYSIADSSVRNVQPLSSTTSVPRAQNKPLAPSASGRQGLQHSLKDLRPSSSTTSVPRAQNKPLAPSAPGPHGSEGRPKYSTVENSTTSVPRAQNKPFEPSASGRQGLQHSLKDLQPSRSTTSVPRAQNKLLAPSAPGPHGSEGRPKYSTVENSTTSVPRAQNKPFEPSASGSQGLGKPKYSESDITLKNLMSLVSTISVPNAQNKPFAPSAPGPHGLEGRPKYSIVENSTTSDPNGQNRPFGRQGLQHSLKDLQPSSSTSSVPRGQNKPFQQSAPEPQGLELNNPDALAKQTLVIPNKKNNRRGKNKVITSTTHAVFSQNNKLESQKKNSGHDFSNSSNNKPSKEGDIIDQLVGTMVDPVKNDIFSVLIENGQHAGRKVSCRLNCLSDESVPLIVNQTRLHLCVKIKKDDFIIVMWATVVEYLNVTSSDVSFELEALLFQSHEQRIHKLYFSWKPFLKFVLTHARKLNKKALILILQLVLPTPECLSLNTRNKLHQQRFQEVVALFGAKDSTFFHCLSQQDFNEKWVKELAGFVVSITKKLDPIYHLLRRYYINDPESLINLLECYAKGFDTEMRSLSAQNFRELPLIPVIEELSGVISDLTKNKETSSISNANLFQLEAHLEPNRINGSWESAEEFLNVHFRLLREECFASIRSQISKARLNPDKDGIVHRSVKVMSFAISDGTIVIKLNYKPHKGRDNLMFGNLLCIDADSNFLNPIWATVKDSDTRKKEIVVLLVGAGSSYIDISQIDIDGQLPAQMLVPALQRLVTCQSGVMIESPTYYHAYKPVLARLQSLENDEFPFQSEILLQSTEPQSSSMNFSYCHDNNYNSKLDESQQSAVKNALSTRFSLIQGPPGCGKTFVGVEIIRTILKSKNFDSPILLLTYKNHALDSMLEGCLQLTENVVRIGGKSMSDKIEPYNLHHLYKEGTKEGLKQLQSAKGTLRELEVELVKTAGAVLADLTVPVLLSFLQQGDNERLQLHSLLARNFKKNYEQIIDQKLNHLKSEQEVKEAVSDILAEDENLSIKLLAQSLRDWLSDGQLKNFLPCPESTLFIKRPLSTSKKNKMDEEGEDKELEEDEAEVMAERQIGLKSKLDFIELSQAKHQLYPELQKRMSSLVADDREQKVCQVIDVWDLTKGGRYALLLFWLRKWRVGKDLHLVQALDEYHRLFDQIKEMEDRRTVNILQSKDIVACTITGCCLRMGMITQLAPSVVIVEEAAEILESQLIAALPSSVQHIVLIGDHRQLPPQVKHYRLAKLYNMGVSIFERLANNGYPIFQLRFHRRGPSSLCPLFSRFYDQEIVPMKTDPILPKILRKLGLMYWWTHSAPATSSGTSYENTFEAAMLVGTVHLLIWRGEVRAEQISIITGYLGQANLIKNLLSAKKIEVVTVCTIDRYQGDENDFIFLSLTRSTSEPMNNSQKQPSLGFLSSQNRTCVALSRARCGLYIFGCSALFENHSTWRNTVNFFKSKNKLGKELMFLMDSHQLDFDHPNDYDMFFKKIDLEKMEMKMMLQNKFVKNLPPGAVEGITNVTFSFGKIIEDLMNGSVLNNRDLGRGRDAHGQKFSMFKVTKVERMFNKEMYYLYFHHLDIVKKGRPPKLNFQVDSYNPWMNNMLESNANEYFLFHGTNPEKAKLIQESGFDDRLAKSSGMFGSGIYFAENADKSDQYSSAAPHMMFLARVLVGKPYLTPVPGNWPRPPAINSKEPTKLFDSIIAISSRKGNDRAALKRHQEFIIFDRYHCFPDFLITYERQ